MPSAQSVRIQWQNAVNDIYAKVQDAYMQDTWHSRPFIYALLHDLALLVDTEPECCNHVEH